MVPIVVAGVCATATVGFAAFKAQTNKVKDNHCVRITLPQWAVDESPDYFARTYQSDEDMMKLAIDISARNVEEDTGGPFGCAIFERHADNSITLVSIGMNRVVALGNSTLHGETVAIQMAQKNLNTFSLQIPLQCMPCDEGTTKMRQFELFTSCEPCAMCLGATLWSGVSRIVCGAGKDDAEAIGFDEGPVFAESYEHLKKAGIGVTKCVLKNEAAKVLQDYGKVGVIYNRS